MRRVRKIVKSLAMAALMAWTFACTALWAYQERFIFPAPQEPLGLPSHRGLPTYKVESLTTGDGLRLEFWASPPRPGRPTIVAFHGNGAQASWSASYIGQLADRGYGVVLAEYRGYSGNPGSPSEPGLIEDGRSYLRWVAERWGDRLPVVLGESIGSGVAVAVAAEMPTLGVVLDSPFTSLADVVASGPMWWAPSFLLRPRFESLQRIGSVRSPVMVIHGKADEIIPVGQGRTLFRAAPCPLEGVFPEGVGHTALGGNPNRESMARLVAFLERLEAGVSCQASG